MLRIHKAVINGYELRLSHYTPDLYMTLVVHVDSLKEREVAVLKPLS